MIQEKIKQEEMGQQKEQRMCVICQVSEAAIYGILVIVVDINT